MKPGLSFGRQWSSSKLRKSRLTRLRVCRMRLIVRSFWRVNNVRPPRNACENQRQPARVTSGHQEYEKAEIELKHLRTMQTEQRRLEKVMADTEKKKAELDGKADAARLQADALALQKREKEAKKADVSERVDALRFRFADSQPEFERQKRAVDYVRGTCPTSVIS